MSSASYDSGCEVLARHFLRDGALTVSIESLATDIQKAVEDWLDDAPARFLLDDEDSVPCTECGGTVRNARTGLLSCECHARLTKDGKPTVIEAEP